MTKKIIYVPQSLKPDQQAELQHLAPNYDIRFKNQAISDSELTQVEIILGWDRDLGAKILDLPTSQLKWIQTSSAGVDYLDLEKIKNKNIFLTNTSGIHAIPIAESVLAMLLARARVIQDAVRAQSQSQWLTSAENYDELYGKKMLIIGAGEIGQRLALVAKALGIHVVGVNRSGHQLENFEIVYQQNDFLDHLADYDIIVNILPLTPETTYFYDENFFNHTQPGAYFINVGRGPSVDTHALITALTEEKIGFAGLDVFESEPLATDSPLWQMDNVLVTPHIAGLARHFTLRLMEIYRENLTSYLSTGNVTRNQVDLTSGY